MKVNFDKFKPTYFILLGVVAIGLYVFFSGHKASYEDNITDLRKNKDDFLRLSPDSPIEDKENFEGLNYFPPNPLYKIKAKLEFITDTSNKTLTLIRSDGKKDNYLRFANAHFKIDQKDYSLLLLKNMEDQDSRHLFLPFKDLTNGNETYGGGRYLDLEYKDNKDFIFIDFNLGYNPYCTYNYRYSCPIPPKENKLQVPIEAGEKIFHHEEAE